MEEEEFAPEAVLERAGADPAGDREKDQPLHLEEEPLEAVVPSRALLNERDEKILKIKRHIERLETQLKGCSGGKSGRAKRGSLSLQLAVYREMLAGLEE